MQTSISQLNPDNKENTANSYLIYNVLKDHFGSVHKLQIVDICCGSFDSAGTNYDPGGIIYQPVVANYLGQKGVAVTGIDFRANPADIDISYTYLSDINILEPDWTGKLNAKFDSLIFLRSWDTPEILLHYQNLLQITDLNQLCLEIAKIYLPQFQRLIKLGGLFFTTDICNFGICESETEIQEYQAKIDDLMIQNGFNEIYNSNGLYGYRKINY